MQNDHPYPVTQAYIRGLTYCLGFWVGFFSCRMQNNHPYPVTLAYIRGLIHCLGFWVGLFSCRMQNAECRMQNDHPYPVTPAYLRGLIHCLGFWVGLFFAECRMQLAEWSSLPSNPSLFIGTYRQTSGFWMHNYLQHAECTGRMQDSKWLSMKIENLQDFVNPARKTVYLSLENCISCPICIWTRRHHLHLDEAKVAITVKVISSNVNQNFSRSILPQRGAQIFG